MSIKYEIHSIKNSQGTGEERSFARIFEREPMAARQLEGRIEASCSLTRADVQATLSALRENMIYELSHGSRFYIPSIGYFSLSVNLDMPEGKPVSKARADYLSVRNIKFRPDASMLKEVKQNVCFERAAFTSKSKKYDEGELLEKLREYLSANGCVNRRDMETAFGLRQCAALKWLKYFVAKGVLKKGGAKNSPVYLLAPDYAAAD